MIRILTLILLLSLTPSANAQLALSDFVVPDGMETLALGLITAGECGTTAAGIERFDTGSSPCGTLGAGSDLVVIPDGGITIQRIRIHTGTGNVTMNRSGSEAWSDHFWSDNGDEVATAEYRTSRVYIQIAGGSRAVSGNNGRPRDAGGGFIRWEEWDDVSILTGIDDGTEFIFALVVPITDNCDMYLGTNNLDHPSDLKLGDSDAIRFYLGDDLVCGNAP